MFFKHPKLILLSVIPILINFCIYLLLFIWLYKKVLDNLPFNDNAIEQFKFLQEFVNALISVIGFMVVLGLCFLGFTFLGGIICAPFYDIMSVEVEKYLRPAELTLYAQSNGFFKEAYISIRSEVQKLLFYLCIIIPLFFIGFIPAAGQIISVSIGTFFSFFYNALEFLDYPMTRKNMKFRKRLSEVQSRGMLSYGFGAICFIIMFLPFINVFLKPLLVVSGTDLYFKKYQKTDLVLKTKVQS